MCAATYLIQAVQSLTVIKYTYTEYVFVFLVKKLE